jgi:hypothetical protein
MSELSSGATRYEITKLRTPETQERCNKIIDYISLLEADLSEAKKDSGRLDKLERVLSKRGTYPRVPSAFLELLHEYVELREALDKLEEELQ